MSKGMVLKLNYTIVAILAAIIFVLSCFGASELVSSVSTSPDGIELPVVMYHHILPSKQGDYILSPTQFEADLRYLKAHNRNTVTAAQVIAFIEKGEQLPENPVMITFDDGYESVHEYAMPLLKKYGMTAVSSIIGKHTDLFSNPEETRHLNYSHSSWKQLREMQASGLFEIGNHTYDLHHTPNEGPRYGIKINANENASDYRSALVADVDGLQDQFEVELGNRPLVFAYPFGAICKESKQILKEMGFKLILTCEEKVNCLEPGQQGPVSIKRFNRAAKYDMVNFFARMNIK